jgi:hypothetical protein
MGVGGTAVPWNVSEFAVSKQGTIGMNWEPHTSLKHSVYPNTDCSIYSATPIDTQAVGKSNLWNFVKDF